MAEEGFKWEVVEGAGLKFWAETNGYIRVVTNDSLPGAEIEWNDSVKCIDLLSQLKEMPGWEDKFTREFKKVNTHRQGVNRYVLKPTGTYQKKSIR